MMRKLKYEDRRGDISLCCHRLSLCSLKPCFHRNTLTTACSLTGFYVGRFLRYVNTIKGLHFSLLIFVFCLLFRAANTTSSSLLMRMLITLNIVVALRLFGVKGVQVIFQIKHLATQRRREKVPPCAGRHEQICISISNH